LVKFLDLFIPCKYRVEFVCPIVAIRPLLLVSLVAVDPFWLRHLGIGRKDDIAFPAMADSIFQDIFRIFHEVYPSTLKRFIFIYHGYGKFSGLFITRNRYVARKTVTKAERAWFLDHKGEESEAGVRKRFPRWGNLLCFQVTYLFLALLFRRFLVI
jgi:hypothetical protein